MPTISYKTDFLLHDLKDRDKAAEYLTAAIDEGEEVFLLAVKDVVEAQIAIGDQGEKVLSDFYEKYKSLDSDKDSGKLISISSLLDKLGLQLKFAPKLQGDKVA